MRDRRGGNLVVNFIYDSMTALQLFQMPKGQNIATLIIVCIMIAIGAYFLIQGLSGSGSLSPDGMGR
jgi:hypothetical protein